MLPTWYGQLPRFGDIDGVADEVEAREGGEVVAHEPGPVDPGIGGGAHGDDDVAEFDIGVGRAAAADPHDAFDTEVFHELGEIDRGRGNPHPVRHDRDLETPIAAGEAEDISDIADQACVLEKFSAMYFARSGSPGMRTVGAKSPGSALMCGVAIRFLRVESIASLIPRPHPHPFPIPIPIPIPFPTQRPRPHPCPRPYPCLVPDGAARATTSVVDDLVREAQWIRGAAKVAELPPRMQFDPSQGAEVLQGPGAG